MARLWYDARLRAATIQVAVLGLAGLLALWLATNTAENLARRGIAVGFDFLGRVARFPISESLIAYAPSDTFARAFAVGLVNTLFIAGIIVVGSTILGLFVGLARRSQHPLAFGIATVFVETMRNTPLVVQLLFWYALVTVGLPNVRQALNPLPGTFLSVRGLFVPSFHVGGSPAVPWTILLVGIIVIAIASAIGRRKRVRTGHGFPYGSIAAAAMATGLGATWIAGLWSVSVDTPRLQGFSFVGGTALTPEFASLVVGMVLYSSCFIGEIIRGGIDAVGKGQWEAGRSVGLSERQSLRLVVIPQALRVIIPPMTSQYFNIVKNTTLALVVGYPDISYVVATTINQTGQAIEGVLILMAVFLSISAVISLFMNWYNRKVALVQR
jgi:general L-amino acid transport system permease protein